MTNGIWNTVETTATKQNAQQALQNLQTAGRNGNGKYWGGEVHAPRVQDYIQGLD